MKVLGVIVNIFFPGIGTMIVGRIGTGIVQLLLYMFGVVLTITAVGAIIGIPIMFIVWVWAIVSAASTPDQPVVVNVVNQQPPQTTNDA